MKPKRDLEEGLWYLMRNGTRKRITLMGDMFLEWQGDRFVEDTGRCRVHSFIGNMARALEPHEEPPSPMRSMYDIP